MKIEKIVYQIDEEKNVFDSCTVFYEDGTSDVTKDVLEKIMEFMNQEGLTLSNVMNDPRIIKDDKKKNIGNNIVDNNNVNNQTNKNIVKEQKLNNKTSKSSGKVRKALISVTAIAAAVVLVPSLIDYFLNKNKSKTFSNNKTRVEQSVNDLEVSINTVIPEVTQKPVVVEKNDTPKDDGYNEKFRENVSETIEQIDPLTRNVMRLNSGEVLYEEEILETLNGINRLCQANMAEVEKLIEGGNMSGDKIFPLFDEMFPEGSIEKKVISNFTSRRNVLVDTAYYQDRNITIEDVNKYNDFFLDFIFGDVTFEHNGLRYGYYDISPISRYIVFMLGQTTLETNHNYSKDINGNKCDFSTIVGELENNYNLVVSQLFSGSKAK